MGLEGVMAGKAFQREILEQDLEAKIALCGGDNTTSKRLWVCLGSSSYTSRKPSQLLPTLSGWEGGVLAKWVEYGQRDQGQDRPRAGQRDCPPGLEV